MASANCRLERSGVEESKGSLGQGTLELSQFPGNYLGERRFDESQIPSLFCNLVRSIGDWLTLIGTL